MMRLRKTAVFILSVLLSAALASGLTGCGTSDSPGAFLVYYTNAEEDDIVYREWEIPDYESLTQEKLTNLLLNKMFETDNMGEGIHSAKPASVGLKGFEITDNLITFDFDKNYLSLTNVQEIMLRAALVLTIIQQPGITQVMVTVEGEPLTDSSGRSIGVMNAGNFVDILLSEQGMLRQETDLTLFFRNEDSTRLVPAQYHFTISNSNTSMEEYILQQLKAGPSADENTYRTLAEDVEILSVATSDYVCYVNFGKNFLEQEQSCSDDIMIYSIVNSLCTLPYVNSVQFMVDGSNDVMLHSNMDLSKPLKRNRDLEQ